MQHKSMIKKYNFKTYNNNRTFDICNDSDSLVYTGIHDFIKYIKHGYGKISDHLTREIRWGRIEKVYAKKIENNYLSNKILHVNEFIDWLAIDKSYFWDILNNYVNREIFTRKSITAKKIFDNLKDNYKSYKSELFINQNILPKTENKFRLLEKGHK